MVKLSLSYIFYPIDAFVLYLSGYDLGALDPLAEDTSRRRVNLAPVLRTNRARG